MGQPGPPLAPWWWSPGTRHAQHSASEKRALSCLPISATAAASWERLPLGKCRASHKLRIMAVGLAFEAKKLRWLEGDRGTTSGHRDVSTSRYQPRASLTLCSIPLPGSHSIPAFIRRCRMRPEALSPSTIPPHPQHCPQPALPVEVELLCQCPPVGSPCARWVQAADDLLADEEGDLEGTGAHQSRGAHLIGDQPV